MRPRAAALAAVVAFAVAVTGVAVVAARSGDGSGLEPLPFAVPGAERSDVAMSLAAPVGGGVEYVVQGTLPDLPDDAPGYRLGRNGASGAAKRLAGALGVDLDKVTVESVPGLPWYVTSDTLDRPAGHDRVVAACRAYVAPRARPNLVAPDIAAPDAGSCRSDAPMPVADLPTKAEAERIAREAFGKLGIPTDGMQVLGGQSSWEVSVASRVHGLPTIGLEHGLSIGSKGGIVGAHGYLAEPERIGDYPLAGVQAGLDRLRNGVGAPEHGTKPVVGITGVHLALLHVGDTLVPVYVFEAAGDATFPVPAVTGRWLEKQEPEGPRPFPDTVDEGSGACSAGASVVGLDPGTGGAEDANQPLTVQVCVEPTRVKVGQEVRFEVTVVDPDAEIYTGVCEAPATAFGDEEFLASTSCAIACRPSGEPGVPGKLSTTYRHAYTKAGTYTARFPFRSGPCTKGASRGEGSIEVVVVE